jgi:hypothetical protein
MVVDAKLLTPNGKAIMGSLIKGIEAARPELQRTLSGLTSDIPAMSARVFATNTYRTDDTSPDLARSYGGPARKFGPYHLQLNDGTLASFVVDTVTGEPEMVSATNDEGSRKRGWAGSGRK